jgi:hypothetical protein
VRLRAVLLLTPTLVALTYGAQTSTLPGREHAQLDVLRTGLAERISAGADISLVPSEALTTTEGWPELVA